MCAYEDILTYLRDGHDYASYAELAEHAGCKERSAERMVANMQLHGLVEVEPNGVILTEKGIVPRESVHDD